MREGGGPRGGRGGPPHHRRPPFTSVGSINKTGRPWRFRFRSLSLSLSLSRVFGTRAWKEIKKINPTEFAFFFTLKISNQDGVEASINDLFIFLLKKTEKKTSTPTHDASGKKNQKKKKTYVDVGFRVAGRVAT